MKEVERERMDFEGALSACLEANLKIIFLVLIGAVLTYSGHLDQKGVSDLGAITYYVALPSLIFTNVGASLHAEDLSQLWIFPFTAIIYVLVAFLFSLALCVAFGVEKREANAVIAAMMFGNTGSLAIALVASLATSALPTDSEPVIRKAVSYIALFLVGQNLIMFSWGEYLLSNPISLPMLLSDATKDGEHGDRLRKESVVSHRSIVDNEDVMESEDENRQVGAGEERNPLFSQDRMDYGTLEHEESTSVEKETREGRSFLHRDSSISPADLTRVISRIALDTQALIAPDSLDGIRQSDDETRQQQGGDHVTSSNKDLFGDDYEAHFERDIRKNSSATSLLLAKHKWYERLKAFMALTRRVASSPPLLSAIFGLLVACLPPLQNFLFGPSAPLRSLTGALSSAGKMQVPASMLMLSGAGTIRIMESLHKNADPALTDSFQFSTGARAIILFGRSICMGLVGFGWYHFCIYMEWIQEDGLIPFVLFLEAIVPSAQNVVMLLLVHGDVAQGRAMAVSILEQYAVSIPFLTLYLVYFIVLTTPF